MRRRKEGREAQYMSEEYAQALVRLAENLQRFRRERGWTQEQAAAACEMDTTYYGNLERKRHNVTLLSLVRCAKGFGVDISELLKSTI